jgi:hypothetical protein
MTFYKINIISASFPLMRKNHNCSTLHILQ